METLLSALSQKTSLSKEGIVKLVGLPSSGVLGKNLHMTREQVEAAAASGKPFTLLMADGREYLVPHRDYIFFPPKATFVIVYEDDGHYYVLPVRTMTGLKSREMDDEATTPPNP